MSVYNHFLIKRKFKVNKKQIFSSEKMRNSASVSMIMLTRSSEGIFSLYSIYTYIYKALA